MMKNLCAVSFLVASLYAGNVYAQPAAVKKIIEIGTTDNRVMHQLDVLTNRFGGRPIGSDAYDNAAEWMLREFRSWGIEAHLEEAGELPVGFNRGPWFGRLIGGDHESAFCHSFLYFGNQRAATWPCADRTRNGS